jgi:rfaE bifunctional protein kinase chain/domain
VALKREETVPGGAANVAANIAALGARAELLSVVGADREGQILRECIAERGVSVRGVFVDRSRETTHKVRIVGEEQHIVRLDRESTHFIGPVLQDRLLKLVRDKISSWDALIISDYAKGVLTPNIAGAIVRLAQKQGKKTIVDAKPASAEHFKGAYLFTPNSHEASVMADISDITQAGLILQKNLGAHILITRGIEGMTLFSGKKVVNIPAKSHTVFDVVGAGDTVAATCALALAAGANLEQAAHLSNCAAGVVVQKRGTATLTLQEWRDAL